MDKTPKIIEQAPPNTEKKLEALVANGGDCIDVAKQLIDKYKLPFIIIQDETDPSKFNLRSSFTEGELWLQKFITVDAETLQMKADAIRTANTPYEVLVYGETGTGKELIAKSQIGNRRSNIRSVNCAGLPRELIESELFGYVQGAFTGASRTAEGLIKESAGGIMFLDEVGELPMDVQAKLLRVIQDKSVRKVGGKVEEPVNTKFVFATNRDLKEEVKEKRFREDLYARISTLELNIKPLRERRCDLVPIVESLPCGKAFLDKYQKELLEGLFNISLNVRSLQQLVIRYSVLGKVVVERI